MILLTSEEQIEAQRQFQRLVGRELLRAMYDFGPLRSLHEALSIIQEEFEEFKESVYRKGFTREQQLSELVQLAAMCMRTAIDCRLLPEVRPHEQGQCQTTTTD